MRERSTGGDATVHAPPLRATERSTGRTATAERKTTVALTDGVELKGGRLVIDGFPASERASLKRSGGRALIAAAARLSMTDALLRLTARQRIALVDEMLPILGARNAKGRASLHDVTARSGAFSLLEQLMRSMRTQDEAGAGKRVAQALVAAAQSETHAGLRTHMERRLIDLPKRVVPPAVHADIKAIAEKLAHERPPLDKWLKGDPPTLKVLASIQDEFWKKEIAEYKRQGYKVTEHGAGKASAEKVLDGKQIHVELREADTDVLDAVSERDVDVIIYTGHAQLGGVAKISLANGPAAADGEKLIAFFACRSKQSVPAIERAYPGQHLLVSDEGTYGHDDAIVSHKLLNGIVQGKTYAEIEKAARREGLWERNNYVMPHETAELIEPPAVYQPRSKTAEGNSISFRPRASAPNAADVPSGPVDDSVGWLNTIHGYWAAEFGNRAEKAQNDKLVSTGFFDPDPRKPDEVVRLTKSSNGEIGIALSSAYANQDPDAVAMLVTFHGAVKLLEGTRPDASPHERRMIALAMMSEYVYFLVEYSDVADTLLRQFAKEHKFPPGLSWPVIEKAVGADKHNDASPIMIDALEKGMEYPFLEVNPARTSSEFRRYVGKALDLLEKNKSEVAKTTWNAIVTGQVFVDSLHDMSKADYARVRRDMAKEGKVLPETPDSRAFRAITTSMAGYEWDNRIYVAPNMSPEDVAAALVHEVNHVLNESEEHYRGDKQILVEEYRAFYAEALFRGEKMTPAKCKALKERVIADYGLKNVTPSDVADRPPGIL